MLLHLFNHVPSRLTRLCSVLTGLIKGACSRCRGTVCALARAWAGLILLDRFKRCNMATETKYTVHKRSKNVLPVKTGI